MYRMKVNVTTTVVLQIEIDVVRPDNVAMMMAVQKSTKQLQAIPNYVISEVRDSEQVSVITVD